MTTIAALKTKVEALKPRINDAEKKASTASGNFNDAVDSARAKHAEVKSKPDESKGYAARAEAAKGKVKAIPGIDNIASEMKKYAVPEPDFCMPLSSNIDIERGFGSATFTRSTTATYIDKSGVMKTAGINEPRFEKEGVLIEASSTNLMEFSHREAQDGYYDEALKLPDGKTPAIKVTRKYNQDRACWTNGFSKKQGAKNPITVSVFFKKGNSDTVYFTARRYYEGENPDTRYEVVDHVFSISDGWISRRNEYWVYHDAEYFSDGWVRISFTTKPMSDGSHNMHSGSMYVTSYSETKSKVGDFIYLGFVQTEELPFATSYIPTSGSPVTRGMDCLGTPFVNTDQPYTIAGELNCIGHASNYAKIISNYSVSGRVEYSSYDGVNGPSRRIMVYRGIQDTGNGFQIGTNIVPDYTKQSRFKFAVRDDGNTLNGYFEGAKQGEAKGVTPPATGRKMSFGQAGQCAFHIRDFRIWHRALTDEQVSML